ncbi:hypothetical protein [Methanoregula sp.]|uniref:hypothetical protein n=1 Tax=Methanoregula sp. TaxID=2052170 RepID=UPI002C7959AC|nr:hypothetical protein [Methanoregula sp.]HVP96641.1 hypothetical protein [Methanoregula sp.]
MPEPTTSNQKSVASRHGCIDEHTCACGEKHEEHEAGVSHRESCTSPLKFGETCCCQSEDDAKNARHSCGHGPRCR